MVSMAELGALKASKISKDREARIYRRIWDCKDQDTNIAKMVQYTRKKWGRTAQVYENLFVTSTLIKNEDFQLQHALYDLSMKALGEQSTIVKGMPEGLFDSDARVMLAFALIRSKGIDLHFLLAREDKSEIWFMNPDGGTDRMVTDFSDWISRPWAEYVGLNKAKYIFTGVFAVLK